MVVTVALLCPKWSCDKLGCPHPPLIWKMSCQNMCKKERLKSWGWCSTSQIECWAQVLSPTIYLPLSLSLFLRLFNVLALCRRDTSIKILTLSKWALILVGNGCFGFKTSFYTSAVSFSSSHSIHPGIYLPALWPGEGQASAGDQAIPVLYVGGFLECDIHG